MEPPAEIRQRYLSIVVPKLIINKDEKGNKAPLLGECECLDSTRLCSSSSGEMKHVRRQRRAAASEIRACSRQAGEIRQELELQAAGVALNENACQGCLSTSAPCMFATVSVCTSASALGSARKRPDAALSLCCSNVRREVQARRSRDAGTATRRARSPRLHVSSPSHFHSRCLHSRCAQPLSSPSRTSFSKTNLKGRTRRHVKVN